MKLTTQPVCISCWNKTSPYQEVAETTAKVHPDREEQCCMCGNPAEHGLYKRVDRKLVKFPQPRV